MAKIDMVMPQMGESIAEGTILKWLKNVGDKVERDETILEISTDKVDSEIPAPAAGVLTKILVEEGKTVAVGTPIAVIETDVTAAAEGNGRAAQPAAAAPATPAAAVTAEAPVSVPAAGGEVMREGRRFYSPLVREIARQENLTMAELEAIPGSGEGGRVTKRDILAYLEQRKARPAAPAPPAAVTPAKPAAPAPAPVVVTAKPAAPVAAPAPVTLPQDQERVEIVPMDNMRRRIAEHMVMSKQTSPHVYSVSVCDLTRIVKYRERVKNEFEQREGTKLTYTPFFLAACVRAIREFPLINASIEGTNIIIKKAINLGVAVALDNGLIVPVIKNADALNLVGLARATNDLAQRARHKQLKPDEVQGGTFSVTNMGSFGNLFGIPVINQPQVAILGIGAIRKTPVVVGDGIAIRDIVYLSLSYDHRLIDGAYGGQFLQRIVEHLEAFELPQ
ncbi:MAG: 2-oxo acid dehydrogenase subunit E2 [candidate division KSB1 bacterium]|nr:2-oxo acid dehydrogenase subunit E2 [candidate division KSB1 bacterium]MDZ7275582.1 2-oxo acid dehydrogenase subunit E2 [candidate division KSB1 bacterium]MDZ7284727.1 2-oxo acid dehydrogenase subunit E2 [candidate division KSB1 bacterium]MDZ7297854.1 2-oxo acid dehydrogenase subunit E2 [candidate division KSB1 bacterium]MDZ7348719.1 2-oxo acid dehydrogenase subunit E2 [candidate division KSB1 bacterium]